jgi:hypothetical protein
MSPFNPFLGWSVNESTIVEPHYWPSLQARDDDGMMLSVEQPVKCLAGETEVLGENLLQCYFVHHKSQACTRAVKVGSRCLTAFKFFSVCIFFYFLDIIHQIVTKTMFRVRILFPS